MPCFATFRVHVYENCHRPTVRPRIVWWPTEKFFPQMEDINDRVLVLWDFALLTLALSPALWCLFFSSFNTVQLESLGAVFNRWLSYWSMSQGSRSFMSESIAWLRCVFFKPLLFVSIREHSLFYLEPYRLRRRKEASAYDSKSAHIPSVCHLD